jgi:uncharacterized membrane protein
MDYIIAAFSILALDSVYLSTIGGPLFATMVRNIQKEDMKIDIYGVLGSYILIILVLYKFIIMDRRSPNDAFILGLCVYGIYEFTNIAIFKNYKWIAVIVDTLWGGILFYTATYITYKILSIKY